MNAPAALVAALVCLTPCAPALADGTSTGPTYTTKVVDITGRRAQPIAAVEVTRALPSLRLRDLRPAFPVGVEAVGQGPL